MKKILILLCAGLLLLSGCSPRTPIGVDSSGLKPFVIGGIAPLTEEYMQYGLSVKNGAQLAADEINATGGVNGFRLVMNFQDSKADPKTAVTVYEKLKTNDMTVLLGGVFSDETAALAEATAKDGIPTITPTATDPIAVGTAGNVFRVCLSSHRLGTTAANFLADKKLATTAAAVYSDDRFGGKQTAEAFLAACTAREITATPVQLPTAGSRSDLQELIHTLESQSYDVIFLALSPEYTEDFLSVFQRKQEIILSCNLPEPGAAAENVTVVSSFFPDGDTVLLNNFTESYLKTYGIAPDRYAADAYDAVYAIAEAIRKAGITPENAEEKNINEALLDAMTKIEVMGVTGTLSWTTDGESTRPATVRICKNGLYVPYESEENE